MPTSPPRAYADLELDASPGLGQDQETLVVTFEDGHEERMRLHEYGRVYAIPGLYDEVVQDRLQCLSPSMLASRLVAAVREAGEDPAGLRVLDTGAGNGVVGEELREHGVTGLLIGNDAEPEAKPAAERDRPGLYAEYHVGDLAELAPRAVAEHDLNALTGAAALGLGHIPVDVVKAAWDAFPAGSWLAVTAAEDALDHDRSGALAQWIADLRAGAKGTDVRVFERFQHRLRMSGEPIHYHVIVARKQG